MAGVKKAVPVDVSVDGRIVDGRIDDLLRPISGSVSRVRGGRFESPEIGELGAAGKWDRIHELASEWLKTKTKDLEAIKWLAVALLHKKGFEGGLIGLEVLRQMLLSFWDKGLEPEDAEDREVALRWLNSSMANALRNVAVTKRTDQRVDFSLALFDEAQFTGAKSRASDLDEARRHAFQQRLKEGKPTLEDWEQAVQATPPSFFLSLSSISQKSLESFSEIATFLKVHLAERAPDLARCQNTLASLVKVSGDLADAKRPNPQGGVFVGTARTTPDREEAKIPSDGSEPIAGPQGTDWHRAIDSARMNLPLGLSKIQELAGAESSGRDRFFRRAALAEVYRAKGKSRAASVILEDLVRQIDELKLHEWENSTEIARIWIGACECRREGGNSKGADELFERLCKLAPWHASELGGENK